MSEDILCEKIGRLLAWAQNNPNGHLLGSYLYQQLRDFLNRHPELLLRARECLHRHFLATSSKRAWQLLAIFHSPRCLLVERCGKKIALATFPSMDCESGKVIELLLEECSPEKFCRFHILLKRWRRERNLGPASASSIAFQSLWLSSLGTSHR